MTPDKCLNTKLREFEWAVKSQGHNPVKIECPFWRDSSYFWVQIFSSRSLMIQGVEGQGGWSTENKSLRRKGYSSTLASPIACSSVTGK